MNQKIRVKSIIEQYRYLFPASLKNNQLSKQLKTSSKINPDKINLAQINSSKIKSVQNSIISEAAEFIKLFYKENNLSIANLEKRLIEICIEVEKTGTYQQTKEEITYGSKVAWRNSSRCIGRIFWQTLTVRDLRHLSTAEEIFQAILEHIQLATNGGKIRPVISIFPANQPGRSGIRIWNPLLIRYAGYEQPDGTIIGDPAQLELTKICQRLGWESKGTPFDILPLIIQIPGENPQLFEIPQDIVLEVPITHPELPWFADLGLKWHALPCVSSHCLEIGGVSYSAAPFNGWYMSTEIASRNFGDAHRYNLLPIIAEKLGLDTRSKLSLWKDRALIELNTAVLHSFSNSGILMVDHHTASEQFMMHCKREASEGRTVPADWGWIIPPISASATKVFHQEFENILLKPNLFPQPEPWKNLGARGKCPFH
ncbi:MAG: nitric oxide synthase oxygenase [Mastigocoleus sp. MO_167.B18]|uniref:nitric oxide synthase oxygenase n=1 Tax=Mastigocoleus sp. MO_188.B34 TaxID=3036635 RepID=UPI0026334E5D|nr:nitric oxide synthase oxygenase [Mastigocoleus sp. MO_188.B34]MDJ0694140.1 nitric oxide synthase oxygenase [Mastigocoleus sp. MO_188.B34]MDJ0771813.1 nitric oxide synthase oxygenase [Mastigocoleus sp. MO_167.B18]